ncbi:hypothetical protein CERSUDRAFT_98503 [Gelatoporia subvermispora B]|uniref:Uncharacterized protein n=1 Tax=Ceriporiopsis subvermispora (strain B) TaxID=914234 RepID=M2Q954_CERS8|nr:hypothetical protein CERSUDRAFT_98503 [Gelatoporia subvermispora B]
MQRSTPTLLETQAAPAQNWPMPRRILIAFSLINQAIHQPGTQHAHDEESLHRPHSRTSTRLGSTGSRQVTHSLFNAVRPDVRSGS